MAGTNLGGPQLGSPSGAQFPAQVGPIWGPHENADWVKFRKGGGAEKVSAMLKWGHNKFWGSFSAEA